MEQRLHPLEAWRVEEVARMNAPLPKYELAKRLGCSPSRYTQIVNDGKSPSPALAKRIKALTGISLDVLLEAAE